MKMFSIGKNSNIGGYFSSEQIDFLSIVQCSTHEELLYFISHCAQLKGIYSNEIIHSYINQDLEQVKRDVFETYQNTLVPHDSNMETVLDNALSRLQLDDDDDKNEIIKILRNGRNKEGLVYIRDYLTNKYPSRAEQLFIQVNRFVSTERDQNKNPKMYDEIVFLNGNLSEFDTMLLGSIKPEIVINELLENENKFDFYFAKRDLEFACKNNKHVRLHSLLTKTACETFFDKQSKEEILETMRSYVKETIDFINEYNRTHKHSDGTPVINSVDLFNEIVSFDKNENGEYENIWEKKHGITIQDICSVFKYAQEHKPDGVSCLYNEPFLEEPERRKKVIEVLNDINSVSEGLIDTLGSQMHITFRTPDEQIKSCFQDFKKIQEEKGLNIQITEFDLSLSEREVMMIIEENPRATYNQAYEMKKNKIRNIESIIKSSGINLSGISYWSLTDKTDSNLERIRSNLFKKGIIQNIEQVPTVCGGCFPTSKQYSRRQDTDQEDLTMER